MCIICIKKKGVKSPNLSIVKNMCDNNPDGFAFVYRVGSGRVKVYRTMDKDCVMKLYRSITSSVSDEDLEFFFHARIATHGSVRINNCHGFSSEATGQKFAHNGILSIKNREDMTDSETFFRDIFEPVYLSGGWSAAERAIRSVIGTSKFVFLSKTDGLRYYGDYTEQDGVLYSNHSYICRKSFYTGFYNPIQKRDGSYRYTWKYEDKNAKKSAKPESHIVFDEFDDVCPF